MTYIWANYNPNTASDTRLRLTAILRFTVVNRAKHGKILKFTASLPGLSSTLGFIVHGAWRFPQSQESRSFQNRTGHCFHVS